MRYDDEYKEYDGQYSVNNENMDDEEANGDGDEYMNAEYTPDCHGKHPRKIEVEEVLGVGKEETFTEICVPLIPPAFEILDELIDKKVVFDALVASKNKVFINGRLIKDIPYKTKVETCAPGCVNVSKATYGLLRHVTVEVPFAMCIHVPGALKGAKVVVLHYDVTSVEIPSHRGCIPGHCVSACEPEFLKNDVCQKRLIRSITEKDCIMVKVKVVKPAIISLPQ